MFKWIRNYSILKIISYSFINIRGFKELRCSSKTSKKNTHTYIIMFIRKENMRRYSISTWRPLKNYTQVKLIQITKRIAPLIANKRNANNDFVDDTNTTTQPLKYNLPYLKKSC